MSTAIGDCRACGLCCFASNDAYVRVTGADWARLAGEAETWAGFIGHRAYMKMADGHCAALRIETGGAGTHVFTCAIYDRRPEVCRVLERGSPACEAERERKASPALFG